MCGIGGIMTIDGTLPDGGALDRLSKLIAHRGPDGKGKHLSDDVGLVQTRLAIIDLDNGDQPIYACDSNKMAKAALVANGEIYNYVELKGKIDRANFSTKSDCELPLHLYLSYGADFSKLLRGMYAIAIHDLEKRQLILSRDPFGIKPLYYSETDYGFVFASEAQAILRAGLVSLKLNNDQRDELMQLQFTTGKGTIFQGIHRMLPGETLVVQGGRIVMRSYQRALPSGERKQIQESVALEELDTALMDSIDLHQRSDVPYGMFFSGGIDSSVILTMMSRLNERPVKALTAGFAGSTVHDERSDARSITDSVGAEHIEVEFAEEDFFTLLPKIASAIDDPTADYAILPTFKLAARARAEGLKVILSGEGGDELFGGYGRYRKVLRPWPFSRAMRRKGLFHGTDVLRENSKNWRTGFAISEKSALSPERSALQVAQAIDCSDWLTADLLTKLDRCLMANGVEGRVPFLDPAIAQVAFLLPDYLKIRNGKGKWLLRRWLQINLPAACSQGAKRGFTVPVSDWIAGRSRKLAKLIAVQPGIQEICRPGGVEALFSSTGQRQGKAQWTLLFYALWHQAHIVGQPSQGDIFDALSS